MVTNELLIEAVVGVGFAVHGAAEALPRHPAHWRRSGETVVKSARGSADVCDCEERARHPDGAECPVAVHRDARRGESNPELYE